MSGAGDFRTIEDPRERKRWLRWRSEISGETTPDPAPEPEPEPEPEVKVKKAAKKTSKK